MTSHVRRSSDTTIRVTLGTKVDENSTLNISSNGMVTWEVFALAYDDKKRCLVLESMVILGSSLPYFRGIRSGRYQGSGYLNSGLSGGTHAHHFRESLADFASAVSRLLPLCWFPRDSLCFSRSRRRLRQVLDGLFLS